jgi:hypothetical protein
MMMAMKGMLSLSILRKILWLLQICSGLAGEDAGKDLM